MSTDPNMTQPFHTTTAPNKHFYVNDLPDDEPAWPFFSLGGALVRQNCYPPRHAWAWTGKKAGDRPPSGSQCFCKAYRRR